MRALVRLACACILALPAHGGTGTALAQSRPVIALSNSFNGNPWRRQLVGAFTEQAEVAKVESLISDYVVLNGDGSVAQQNGHLTELIAASRGPSSRIAAPSPRARRSSRAAARRTSSSGGTSAPNTRSSAPPR